MQTPATPMKTKEEASNATFHRGGGGEATLTEYLCKTNENQSKSKQCHVPQGGGGGRAAGRYVAAKPKKKQAKPQKKTRKPRKSGGVPSGGGAWNPRTH